ncbi:hypothetical protein [Chamaesiphon minutus]|uniref:hypothetical protein n=1 Tax=Chamaesiphon minutus TaxID=1173032 RepID=UPI0012FBDD9A|nr:hypothetical protein [Chamaesiphon minutus]
MKVQIEPLLRGNLPDMVKFGRSIECVGVNIDVVPSDRVVKTISYIASKICHNAIILTWI